MKFRLSRFLLSMITAVLLVCGSGGVVLSAKGQVAEAAVNERTGKRMFVSRGFSMTKFETTEFLTQYSKDFYPSSGENILRASAVVRDFQRTVDGYHSDYEVITKVSRWVSGQFEYDEDYRLTGMSDAFVESKGVCWHYAFLFDALMKSYGYPSVVVYGYVGGDPHVWNKVKVNGQWKFFDLVAGCYWLDEGQLKSVLGISDLKYAEKTASSKLESRTE